MSATVAAIRGALDHEEGGQMARPGDDHEERLRDVERRQAVHEAECVLRYEALEKALGELPELVRGTAQASRTETRAIGAVLFVLLSLLLGGAVMGNEFLAAVRGLFLGQ